MVLFITAILLVVIVPSQKIFFDRAKAETLAAKLTQAIRLARDESISSGFPAVLCKSADQKTCSGEWRDGYIILQNKKVAYVFRNNPAEGSLYWRSSLARDFLEFLPEGTTPNENGTFWYCAREAKNPAWAIVVSQSGRARQVLPNSSGEIHDAAGRPLSCFRIN